MRKSTNVKFIHHIDTSSINIIRIFICISFDLQSAKGHSITYVRVWTNYKSFINTHKVQCNKSQETRKFIRHLKLKSLLCEIILSIKCCIIAFRYVFQQFIYVLIFKISPKDYFNSFCV